MEPAVEEDVEKAPSYALPDGTSVRARSRNGNSRRRYYPGKIRCTLPEGDVVIDYVDGDCERVAANNVLVARFDGRTDVPLTKAYEANVNPTRRKRQLAEKMRESLNPEIQEWLWEKSRGDDHDDDECAEQEKADADSSSSDESDTELEPTGRDSSRPSPLENLSDDFHSPFPTAPSDSSAMSHVRAQLSSFQRRAAAHLLLLAGETIRVESPNVALAVALDPNTAFCADRSEEEQERIVRLARATLVREVANELERLGSGCFPSGPACSSPGQTDRDPLPSIEENRSSLKYHRAGRNLTLANGRRSVESATVDIAQESQQIVQDFWFSYVNRTRAIRLREDPLEFWAEFFRVQSFHPAVRNVVRRFLRVPPSAAACERLFSKMTRTRNGRPSMTPSTLRQLVFLKANRWMKRPPEAPSSTSSVGGQ